MPRERPFPTSKCETAYGFFSLRVELFPAHFRASGLPSGGGFRALMERANRVDRSKLGTSAEDYGGLPGMPCWGRGRGVGAGGGRARRAFVAAGRRGHSGE